MTIEELFNKHQEYLFSLDSIDIKGRGGQIFRYKQALQQAGIFIRPPKQTKHKNPPKDLFKSKVHVQQDTVPQPPKKQPSTLLADSGEKSSSKQEQKEAQEAKQPKYRLSKADKALVLEQSEKGMTAEVIASENNYSLTAVEKVING